MERGVLTARVAGDIEEEYKGVDVFVAHGKKTPASEHRMGQIVSWFGSELTRNTRLSFLDIALVSRNSGKTLVLAEIEERPATPKHLMADALATLLGDHITFRHQTDLQLGNWTTLLVLAKTEKRRAGNIQRLELLSKRLNEIKGQLRTPNAVVGPVTIDTFHNYQELLDKMRVDIVRALGKEGRP